MSKLAYNTGKKEAKREVAKTEKKECEKLYERLETRDGQNKLFKVTKQRDRQSKNVHQVRVIKSNNREILVEEANVKQKWKEYFQKLLNEENPKERRRIRTEKRGRDVANISVEEIRNVLRKMEKGKAQGPDNIPVEVWIALGTKGFCF